MKVELVDKKLLFLAREYREVVLVCHLKSDGIFAAETPTQKRLNIDRSRDELFKQAMGFPHWRINPRLVRAITDKSGDTIR